MTDSTTSDDHKTAPDFAGREAAPLVSFVLVLLGLAAAVAGLILYAGSGHTRSLFAWPTASPLTAALLGAGFLGAAPMMLQAAIRSLWQDARIAVLPALVLVTGLAALSTAYHGELRLSGGSLVAFGMSWAWLLAMFGLALGLVGALVAQAREPGFPLASQAPLPRWTLPLVALLGSAYAGLGVGLLVDTDFWTRLVPWHLSDLDTKALAIWALTLGWALLQALTEGDLARVKPGLAGLLAMGVLGLGALAWHRGNVAWSGWPAPLATALVAALAVTGALGLVLERRARAEC